MGSTAFVFTVLPGIVVLALLCLAMWIAYRFFEPKKALKIVLGVFALHCVFSFAFPIFLIGLAFDSFYLDGPEVFGLAIAMLFYWFGAFLAQVLAACVLYHVHPAKSPVVQKT